MGNPFKVKRQGEVKFLRKMRAKGWKLSDNYSKIDGKKPDHKAWIFKKGNRRVAIRVFTRRGNKEKHWLRDVEPGRWDFLAIYDVINESSFIIIPAFLNRGNRESFYLKKGYPEKFGNRWDLIEKEGKELRNKVSKILWE